ncbi:MAG: GWxTD domain-containing protein [bacterium]|nr:GWxTD domain-containing protein [bacterium]
MKINLLVVLIAFGLIVSGCAGKRINIEPRPGDPIYQQKKEFLDRYVHFITPAEEEGFKLLNTTDSFDRFVEEFWKKRDTNPLTPENEYKELIDSRISDIENEIFATDLDIPGTRFSLARGLRGDMARIYLYYGRPHYKEKMSEGRNHGDLMVWYYFDTQVRPLFRFLFYEKYGVINLFKNHIPIINFDYLFDPLGSPLKELSNGPAPNRNDLIELWSELEFKDPQWIFRGAMLEFSSYSDVVIEGGNGKNKFGALDPPEPAAITAARFKPTIIGQPENLSNREFVNSGFNSFIPAIFRIRVNTNTSPYTYMIVKYGDLDWEIKGDKEAESLLLLRISFQNKDSKEIKEFLSGIRLVSNKDNLDKNNVTAKEFIEKNKENFFPVMLSRLSNQIKSPQGTLADLLKGLEVGTYVVNVELYHQVTKKSAGGWREEIVVK